MRVAQSNYITWWSLFSESGPLQLPVHLGAAAKRAIPTLEWKQRCHPLSKSAHIRRGMDDIFKKIERHPLALHGFVIMHRKAHIHHMQGEQIW